MNAEPHPRKRSSKLFLIFLVVVFGLVIVFITYRRRDSEPGVRGPQPVTVTARRVAEELDRFLATLRSEEEFYGMVQCDELTQCELALPGDMPSAAWHILGAAGIYRLGDQARARNLATFYLDRWKLKTDRIGELYSVHQLWDAYQVIGYEPLRNWFLNRIFSFLDTSRKIIAAGELRQQPDARPGRMVFGPFDTASLTATLAKELAQGASALKHQETVAYLRGLGHFPAGEEDVSKTAAEFQDTSRALISIAEDIAVGESLDSLLEKPTVPEFECWPHWARTFLYESTRDEKDIGPVLKFLKETRFSERSRGEVTANSLQAILPCLEMLIRLRDKDPRFIDDYKFILEDLILPSWDYASRRLCGGDGGVFSTIKRDHLCETNAKSASDNAWLLYLLAMIQDERFALSPRRT